MKITYHKTSQEELKNFIIKASANGVNEINLSNLGLDLIPPEIGLLAGIRRLYINNQFLSENPNKFKFLPPEIGNLINLEVLELSENKLDALPPEIGKLTKLQYLKLNLNNLTYLPDEVTRLINLHTLILTNNEFSDLPEQLLYLSSLQHLFMAVNPIKMLPSSIGQIRSLLSLDLMANGLETLPPEIGQLTRLRTLELGGHKLTSLPPEFSNLKNLESLTLGSLVVVGGELTTFPDEITQLNNLKKINLDGNKLSTLPSEIAQLQRLTSLAINENLLTQIPEEIGKLRNLRVLELRFNQIESLPKEFIELNNLQILDLRGNPLPIPPEILEKVNDPKAILSAYFGVSLSNFPLDQFIQNDQILLNQLSEAKINFIGQGSVGKTSLIQRILHNKFDVGEPKTDSISINCWQVSNQTRIENQKPLIQLNIWDFGGQEIMHATHQFFLTKRSLYLLVIDARNSQEQNQVEYWLKIIQSFGGESPVLIIGNKIDQHPLDIDRTGLQKKYPNIVGILETSAATGAGIEELKTAITEQVNNLPHVRDLLPETWFTVKTKLETLGRESNFITHDKYLELCVENEVSDETSQRTLIGFLHDLGVVLHFQDNPRLEALGILNPQWVTNGVYKILNSHTLFQNKGVLTVSMLDEILNLPDYPRGKRLFIVDMMKKFELCYDIEPDKTFLVPDLLPKDEPAELKFNGIPAFEYAYPVLPSSVITRFIVRMNQHIDDGFVWRTGVLLKIGSNTALVKADIEDRKITIAIDGLEHTRRDVLSAIRYQLDEIHASIKGLNPEKRVPVPGAPNAEPLKYDYLLMLERAGQNEHLVQDGTRLAKVNVREILSGIETESQRKETGDNVTNIYIGGNVSGSNIISGNNNVVTQKIQNSFNKAEAADIQAELKENLKQLAEAVAAMNKSLPEEQAAEAAEDLSRLVDEATKPKPNKKWYSVSVDGLVKAAENLGKVGEPVVTLAGKVLSLLIALPGK